MLKFSDLGLGPVDAGAIVTSDAGHNPFKALGRKIYLPLEGSVVTAISGLQAQGVGEGELKKTSGAAAGVHVGSNVCQVSVVESWQYFTNAQNSTMPDLIFSEFPKAIATTTALITAGVVAAPATWNNFASFSSVTQTVSIAKDEAASVSFDDAAALVNAGVVTGVVLSTAMLAYLKRQRNTKTGTRVFEIEGTITSGTIDGLRYETFASATAVGFLGNFDNYVYGDEPFNNPITGEPFTLHTAGMETDFAGTVHNLNGENKVALRYEQRVGSGIADLDSFVKITPAE